MTEDFKLPAGSFYEYPLSDKEIADLRKGLLVMKNFSPPLQPQIIYCVVVWNKDIMKKLDPTIFSAMLSGGFNVANIPFQEAQFQQLADKGAVQVHFAFGWVVVALESTYKEVQQIIDKKKRGVAS